MAYRSVVAFDWHKIPEWLDRPLRDWIGAALAAGLLLFLPDPAAQLLGLNDFRNAARPWLGGAFLVFSVVVAVKVGVHGWEWLREHRRIANVRTLRHNRINTLSPVEKALLKRFIV